MRTRTLLTVARRAGIRVGFPCRGEGVCGMCTVVVLEGSDGVEPPDGDERRLLRSLPARDPPRDVRISCLSRARPGHALLLSVGGGTYRVET
jgi:adenylate cyclase